MILDPNRRRERPGAAPFAQFAGALALAALVAATSTFAFDVMPDDSELDGEAVILSVITHIS